jgi:pantetheine-phosphate adenylyltransferase
MRFAATPRQHRHVKGSDRLRKGTVVRAVTAGQSGQAAAILAAMPDAPHIALFPGTFDPITNGHLDIIRRGVALFDQLVVAIGTNPAKRVVFDVDERRDIIRQLVADLGPKVKVDVYEGLTVDYARRIGATAILRGLRNATDLHFEFQLALTNRAVAEIETVFIMTGETYAFTSSTLIKQIASGGDIDRLHRLLPPLVLDRLKSKKQSWGGRIPWHHEDHLKE